LCVAFSFIVCILPVSIIKASESSHFTKGDALAAFTKQIQQAAARYLEQHVGLAILGLVAGTYEPDSASHSYQAGTAHISVISSHCF
jgi:hypothetical protein